MGLMVGQVLCSEQRVILLNDIMSSDEADKLWPYKASSFTLAGTGTTIIPVGEKCFLYDFKKDTGLGETKLKLTEKKSLYVRSAAIKDNIIYATAVDRRNGRSKVVIYGMENDQILKAKEHHGGSGNYKILRIDEDGLLVSGLFMSGYSKTLDRYDQNSRTPSKFSIQKFDDFFRNNKAFNLCRYDNKFGIADSADFVSRTGEDLENYKYLNEFNPVDVDDTGNIYCLSQSAAYEVHTYDRDLKLLKTLPIENSNYRPLPSGLTRQSKEEFRNKAGSYSQAYGLFAGGGLVVATFYQSVAGYTNKPEGPYYYDVLDLSGTKVGQGQLPYPIFCKDDQQNLYLLVKQPSTSYFGDDKYFLAEVTVQDLLADRITKSFVEARIKKSGKK